MRARPAPPALLATYAAGLLLLTLSPVSWALNRLTVRLYVLAKYDLRGPWNGSVTPEQMGGLLNVLLFIPLGWAVVRLLRRSARVAVPASVVVSVTVSVLVSVLVSGTIELVQLLPALHRQASWSDLLTNATGGGLGGLLAGVMRPRASRIDCP